MGYAVFVLVILFVIANVYVESVNESATTHWWREPLSHYLAGVRCSLWLSAAYLGLALAEVLLAFSRYGHWQFIALLVAAAALLGVVATAWWKHFAAPPHRFASGLHVAFAGVAYVAGLVAEALYLWHTPSIWFVIGGVATTFAFARFAPHRPALEEKGLTAWVLAGLVAIVGVPL